MMIKHVLFDADGVLIHAEMFSHEVERKYGISQDEMKEFYQGIFLKTHNGEEDLKEIIAPYLKKWGWSKSVDEYLNEWFAFEHKLDQQIIDYVQKLREQGIGCYVATNQERYRAQYMLENMGFKDIFDRFYASAHLGAQKPDVLFFEKIINDLGADKQEVLFWDDTKAHVESAKQFGINAEFFTSFHDFVRIMKDKYEVSV